MLPGVSIPGVVSRGEGDHHEEGDNAAVGFHNRTASGTKYIGGMAALIIMNIGFLYAKKEQKYMEISFLRYIKQCCGSGSGIGSVRRIRFFGLLDPDPLVRGTAPNPSIIKQNSQKDLDSYGFVTSS